MLLLVVLAFIVSVSDVMTTGKSNRAQSHAQDIIKRSDGLMHELVKLLADMKFNQKTNKMVDRMVKQNDKILKQLAVLSKTLDTVKGKTMKETKKVKKIAFNMKKLQKEVGDGKKEQNKIKKTMKTIQEKIGDFNNKNITQELTKTTLLSKQLKSSVDTINNKITHLKNAVNIEKGAVYIRWGRTRCPSRDTVLVYSGYAAGSHFTQNAGVNTQCLPKDPSWRRYHDGYINDACQIYGAEYQVHPYSVGEALHNHYHDYNVPCAVCQSKKRLNVHMIPAKDRCYNGWHLEYRGYLMAQRHDQGASKYLCVDARPEKIGSKSNQDGRLFYPVEGHCHSGSLPCPPYVPGRELTCAVCTF